MIGRGRCCALDGAAVLGARAAAVAAACIRVHVRGVSVCAVATAAACEWDFTADVVVALSS